MQLQNEKKGIKGMIYKVIHRDRKILKVKSIIAMFMTRKCLQTKNHIGKRGQ